MIAEGASPTLEERVARIEAVLAGEPAPASWEEVSVGAITRWAAFQMGLSVAEIVGEGRTQRQCRARWAVIWVARTAFGYSTPRIGRAIGGRDHTTVISALRRAEALRGRDPAFLRLTNRMLKAFGDQGAEP